MSPPIALVSPALATTITTKPPAATELATKSTAKSAPITGLQVVEQILATPFSEEKYAYRDLLPWFPDVKWEPLVEHEFIDPALDADLALPNLLAQVDRVEHLTPKFGTVLHGIDLANLNDAAQVELAALIAIRGTVFAKDQKNFDIKTQIKLGERWGKVHRHATTATPRGAAENPDLFGVHVIYSSPDRVPSAAVTQTQLWHSDVSYEVQPPAYTSLKVLEGPAHGGGDTLWHNGYALYDALSSDLQDYLKKHTATHSAVEQATQAEINGKTVRRAPVVTEHPIVRTNPVTGFNAVFVSPGFTRKIVGVPKAESDAILKLLFDLITTSVTDSVRWKWDVNDVALWDNRTTTHSASFGFYPSPRHAVRVTSHAEKPYLCRKGGKSQQETIDEALKINSLQKDGSNLPKYAE